MFKYAVSKREYVGKIYFFSVVSVILVRVLSGTGVLSLFASPSDAFSLLVQCVCMGLLPFLLYMLRTPKPRGTSPSLLRSMNAALNDFGYCGKVSKKDWARTLIIAVLMIFTAKFISAAWTDMLTFFGYTPVLSSPTVYSGVETLFLEILMTAVLPSFFEELTHRGLLFVGLREDYGFKTVFITAALFALMHHNIRQTGYTFYDGIILGLLVYYTRSIYPAMFVHFLNNLASVLGEYAGQHGGIYSYVNMFYNMLLGTVIGRIFYAALFILALYSLFELFRGMKRDKQKYTRTAVLDTYIFSREPIDMKALMKFSYRAALKPPTARRVNVFLAAAVFLSAGATAFSLIWGILR
jgi:membrane protease YdiL (CAAX protease family)